MLLRKSELGHDYSISLYNMQGCPDNVQHRVGESAAGRSEVTRAHAPNVAFITRHTFKPANSIVHSS